jgi:hypothetical protein
MYLLSSAQWVDHTDQVIAGVNPLLIPRGLMLLLGIESPRRH